jgi:hypothetical protein
VAGAVCQPVTPEFYIGKTRGQLGNWDETMTNAIIQGQLPASSDEGRIYTEGDWSNQPEYLRHAVDKDELTNFVALKYRAVELNEVMKPENIDWMQVFVKQDAQWIPKNLAGDDLKFDDEARGYAQVDAARIYNLIAKQPSYGTYELRLYVKAKGFSLYSFSFGTCEIVASGDRLGTLKE